MYFVFADLEKAFDRVPGGGGLEFKGYEEAWD